MANDQGPRSPARPHDGQTNRPPKAQGSPPVRRSAPGDHAYDNPDLSPLEFFSAIYRDKTLPLSVRIDAASKALPYTAHPPPPVFVEREPWPGESRVTIQIGGLPEGTSVTVSSGQEPASQDAAEPRPDALGPRAEAHEHHPSASGQPDHGHA
jgi:hypothetical protein